MPRKQNVAVSSLSLVKHVKWVALPGRNHASMSALPETQTRTHLYWHTTKRVLIGSLVWPDDTSRPTETPHQQTIHPKKRWYSPTPSIHLSAYKWPTNMPVHHAPFRCCTYRNFQSGKTLLLQCYHSYRQQVAQI